METSQEHSRDMVQESVSEDSTPDSGEAMNVDVFPNEKANLPSFQIVNKSEAACSLTKNAVHGKKNESDTDIIILPPPSAKQEVTEQSEIIQTDVITIPFPEAERIKIISDEIIVPNTNKNKLVTVEKELNVELSSTKVLKSSQIESEITLKDKQRLPSTGVTTRSQKSKQDSSDMTFKVPYPVQTAMEFEEMDSVDLNASTISGNNAFDNSVSSNTSLNACLSSTTGNPEGAEGNSLLVEQHSEVVNIEEPEGSLYVEDKGPRIYNVPSNFTSKPFKPMHLPYAFRELPIFGRSKTRAELPLFQRNKIKQFVGSGLDDEEFDNLAAYCCPDNLRTGKELTMQSSPGQGFFPAEVDSLSLKNKELSSTHNLSIIRKLKLRIDRDTKHLYAKRYKYRGVRMIPLSTDDEDNHPVVTIGQPIIPGKELLFVIRWYRPFPYNPKDRFGYRSRHSVFSNNIVMLGRHKLSLLRDRVVCPNDVDMRVDISERPDELPRSSAKDLFPSGFLFINNVFFVDKRPGCVDYTEPLRRWAKARGIGDFPCKDMSEVRLDELVVRLGHPEVYVHQGNCEHVFTISEVRLVSAADPLRLNAYPAHTMLSQNQTIYCTTCAEFGAKWIVVGCPRVPFDPAFFCDRCFKLYLYKDGQKIGNFKAYLYRGNEINALKPQG